MQKIRKAFVVSVMSITVLSMSMLALPVSVGAAVGAGDLVKVDGSSAVYYIDADNIKHVFPNEPTYKSWYRDFSSVQTITATELSGFARGGNVTVRPGTKLITSPDEVTVYAVEPGGVLRSIVSEANAIDLYGANWARRVIDVVPSFMVNYTTGSALTVGEYPVGTLVQMTGDTDVYYYDGTNYRMFEDESALLDNRFSLDDVVTTDMTITAGGTEISGAEADLINTAGGALGDVITSSGLSVALSASTPASGSIISDSTANEYPQALIPFTKVNFTAAADGDVKVTELQFTRTGISADGDLGNLYLYDGNTRVAEYSSFSDKVVTFRNTSGLFTVGAGATKSITLKGDLARGSTSVTSGKTIGFNLVSTDSVSANAASVSGSFPITGNLMSTAVVTDLGHLYFAGTSGANGSIPGSVKADQANVEFWSVNVTADAQDMQIDYLKFTMVGTIDTDDIGSVKLELAGEQVGDAVSMGSDNTLVYDLSSDPIVIAAGQTKALSLRGDMLGGSGRSFEFTIQKSSDVSLYDTEYGVYVTPNVTGVTTAFGVVQATSNISVDSGTITVGVATDSPTGNIPDAATNVTLAKFSFTATGEDVKVESLVASSTCTGLNEVLANVKVLLDGSQVGSTDTSLTCNGGTDTASFTFGNTFVVPAGTTKYLTLVADTTGANIDSGDTVIAALQVGSGNAVGQTTLTSLSTTAQTGRTLTVASGLATATENTSFGDRSATQPSGTVSASGVQIASFVIKAGAGEGIKVTQIKLADDSTTELGDNFQNLKLMHDGTQIGSTIGSLNTTAGTYTFTPATAIQIAAGQQYQVDVYADILSSVADSATVLSPVVAFDEATATGLVTGATASATTNADLQNAYISAQGNLTITLDNDTALAQQVLMGSTGLELAKFKLAADAAEDISISKIVISDFLTAAATGTIKNLKLFVDGAQVGQTINLTNDYATSSYGVFDGISLTIPKNNNKILTVKGDVNTYDNGALSNSGHNISMRTLYDGTYEPITAVGASSGQSITGAYLDILGTTDGHVIGNQMGVYKTLISVAWAPDSPSGSAVGGTDFTVAKINITNTTNVGNYDATIQALNFAISQTGISNTADRELKIYKDVISSGNLLETTSWLASGVQNFGNTAITDAGMTDVAISSGATRLFYVTMDTSDAGSDDKLSIYVDSADVTWNDGVTADISAVNSLPLIPKTLTY